MLAGARVRVIVADNQPLYLDGLRAAVDGAGDLEFVAACADGPSACAAVGRDTADVVVAGETVATSEAGRLFDVAGAQPGTPAVLIVVSQLDRRAIHGFLEAGAAGAVPNDWCRRRMCTAIRTVAAGGTVLAEELHADVRREIRRRALISRERLTLREREILSHLAEGRSAPQIAALLYLGTPTVKTHLHHLYGKLGVADRAAAVAAGMRQGLLS